MISDKDITKLKEVFATKEDFSDLRVEFGELKDEMGELHHKVDTVLEKIDYFVGSVTDLKQENAAGAHTTSRHTSQIEALAVHTGLTLPE
jgi:methyl-accepting chemotaxis protein